MIFFKDITSKLLNRTSVYWLANILFKPFCFCFLEGFSLKFSCFSSLQLFFVDQRLTRMSSAHVPTNLLASFKFQMANLACVAVTRLGRDVFYFERFLQSSSIWFLFFLCFLLIFKTICNFIFQENVFATFHDRIWFCVPFLKIFEIFIGEDRSLTCCEGVWCTALILNLKVSITQKIVLRFLFLVAFQTSKI